PHTRPTWNCSARRSGIPRRVNDPTISAQPGAVSTLVMAGTPIEVIKKWIGHCSQEFGATLRVSTCRPHAGRTRQNADFASKNASKIAEIAPVAPQLAIAV